MNQTRSSNHIKSLYIHIPFCKKKCPYCDFTSYADKENLTPDYIKALKEEVVDWSAACPPVCRRLGRRVGGPWSVVTVYFGGGTPTLLSGEQIGDILEALRSNFKIEPGAEISVEANPGTIDSEKLKVLRSAGVNRLSLGAQSFNDRLLKRLGRIHDVEQIYQSFDAARRAGFDNIGLDLIFAIPGQGLEDWGKTLKSALALEPEHLSTYNLTIEEGTSYYQERITGQLEPAPEDLELAMFEKTIDCLTAHGYEHYEISNFARPGRQCRHNLAYWKNEEYLGLGAGAHSHLNGQRFSNPEKIEDYLNGLNKPNGRNELNGGSEISETIFLNLRLLKGLNLEEFKKRFGLDLLEVYSREIKELLELKLIDLDQKTLKLSRRGLFLANEVFQRFV